MMLDLHLNQRSDTPICTIFWMIHTDTYLCSMIIPKELNNRCGGLCEICSSETATNAYTVPPRKDDAVANQVALCDSCLQAIDRAAASAGNSADETILRTHLEGSIWNPEPAVQALSYRLLLQFREKDWAENLIGTVDFDESVVEWASSGGGASEKHIDAFGNQLESGDTVILTQALNVKGTNFTASKGTIVKRIRLVHDNTEQVEGKINDQTIVILTKFVKKSV